jgi:hypothetical protein
MNEFDTRLSGAAYSLRRVFLLLWRWRTRDGATGLAWGRRAAMRAARTALRSRKSPSTTAEGLVSSTTKLPALAALPQPKAAGVRKALPAGDHKPGGARKKDHGDQEASFAPRGDHSSHLNRH